MNPTTLGDLATLVRSKTPGPFRYTLDVVFSDDATYRRVVDSGVVSVGLVARHR